MTFAQTTVIEIGPSDLELFAVTNPRRGGHEHPGTTQRRTPAELPILPVQRHRRIETTEAPEQIGAHQHECARDDIDLALIVVLLLIDLTGFDHRHQIAIAIHQGSEIEQSTRIIPGHEFGAHHTGIGAVQLGNHGAHRIAFGCHIVVTDQKEAVLTLDEIEDLIGRRTETRHRISATHERIGEMSSDRGLDRIGLGGLGEQHHPAQIRIILRGEALQGGVEPVAGAVRDEHTDDRRRHTDIVGGVLGARAIERVNVSHLHDRSRLAVCTRTGTSSPGPTDRVR